MYGNQEKDSSKARKKPVPRKPRPSKRKQTMHQLTYKPADTDDSLRDSLEKMLSDIVKHKREGGSISQEKRPVDSHPAMGERLPAVQLQVSGLEAATDSLHETIGLLEARLGTVLSAPLKDEAAHPGEPLAECLMVGRIRAQVDTLRYLNHYLNNIIDRLEV